MEREAHPCTSCRAKEVSPLGFRPNTQGPTIVEFAFIRSLWSCGDIEFEKKRGKDTSGSARCGVCAWWWCRPTFPKSLREWQEASRFERVWCTWDPAVRTSGALAFAAQVFDTKEWVSQDHSAPPTPPRFCGNRRLLSNDGSGGTKDDRTCSCGDGGETGGPNRQRRKCQPTHSTAGNMTNPTTRTQHFLHSKLQIRANAPPGK